MIKIITDSSSDLLEHDIKKYGVSIVPMPITFGDETFLSGQNITNEEFYTKLKQSKELPSTSMVNEYAWSEAFKKEVDKGHEVIAFTISSKLSGTFEQAQLAAKNIDEDKIFVIDSLNASFGLRHLIIEATKLRDEKKSASEIVEHVKAMINKVELVAFVDTLHYLKMGGRLTGSAALIGSVLNIKPLVSVDGGYVVSKTKALGKTNAFKKIASQLKAADIDTSKPIIIAHANDERAMAEFKAFLEKELKTELTYQTEIGSTIGVHSGPGAVGVSYVVK